MHFIPNMNVLLIDDDRLTLKALRQMMQSAGHKVYPASNRLNALKKIREEKIDCVVSDVHMPDTTLQEMFVSIRRQSPTPLPIVLISTEPANPDIDKILLKGADAFIPKPVKPGLLDDVIRRLCATAPEPDQHEGSAGENSGSTAAQGV